MLKEFINFLKRHFNYSTRLQCLVTEWDEGNKKIVQNSSLSRRLSVILWTTTHGLYVGFQLATLLFGRHALVDKFVGGLILSVYALCFAIRLDLKGDFLPLHNINRIISSQDSQLPLSRSVLALFKMLGILAELTPWIGGTCMAIMSVFMPCKPPLLGSFILCRVMRQGSSGHIILVWLGTLLLAALEFLMAMEVTLVGFHYAVYLQLPGIIMLWGRCQTFIKSTKVLDTVQIMQGYRHLQIMEGVQNFSFRGRIMPCVILGIPEMEILCGVGLAMLFDRGNLFQVSFFAVIYLDAVLFSMILLTSASLINVRTEGWMKDIKEQNVGGRGMKNSYFRKVIQSFRPLRLEFGNNFVDRLTPLVMQEFCSRQTATLLLLMRQ